MPRRPSLLVVSTILARGGAERFVATLLQHLDRSRIEPLLCLLRSEVGYPLADDVELVRLHHRLPFDLPRTVRRLRRLIVDRRPDVLLSNITATGLVCGLALSRMPDRPRWIARIGSSPLRLDGWLRRMLARRVLPSADLFVVNSRGLVGEVEDFYPFTRGRTRHLANPTDFESLEALAAQTPAVQRSRDRPLLVAVGRLFPEKRYDLMLEAVALARREVELELWICGEGPGRSRLEAAVERRGLASSVRLLGFCENPYALVRQADLFVMSSDHEGLPNALIEAQGLGVPAISTRCPHGPEDIVEDGRTGLLVPVGDARALAAAMVELVREPDRRRELGSAARASIRERFAAPNLTRRWEELVVATAATAGGGSF